MKRILQNGLLLSFGLSMGLIVAELGARILYAVPAGLDIVQVGEPPDFIHYVDAIPWAHSITRYEVPGEYETTVSVNSRGLRGPEVPYAKPRGEFRILYVGDSYVHAAQVAFDDIVYQRLEELLQGSLGRVEVVGAGQTGWGTDQAYRYFSYEGRRYEPDLVIYQFVTNDVVDNARDSFYPGSKFSQHFFLEDGKLVQSDFDLESRRRYQGGVAIHRHLYLFSRLYALGMDIWRGDLEVFRQAQPVYTQLDISPTLRDNQTLLTFQEPSSPAYEDAWSLTESILSAWNAEVREHGSEFAVVYVPSHWAIYDWQSIPELYPEVSAEIARWNPLKPEEYLGKITDRLGIPFLSLGPASRAYASANAPRLYGSKDVHWTRAGHTIAARAIFEWLGDHGGLHPPTDP